MFIAGYNGANESGFKEFKNFGSALLFVHTAWTTKDLDLVTVHGKISRKEGELFRLSKNDGVSLFQTKVA